MTRKRSANNREIFIFSRGDLNLPRRAGYSLMPPRYMRREHGRVITQYTAQLARHYHSLNCRNILHGKEPGLNPRPVMLVDYNWASLDRPVKASIVIFEGGYGFVQIGKGRVRSFVIGITSMPNAEFDTWEYEQEVIVFFRRMVREGQI